MKNIILVCLLFLLPSSIIAQEHSSLETIGEFSDSLIAIKKADKWGFVDIHNEIMINYRNDINSEEYNGRDDAKKPIFKNGLCIITQYKEGIPYYGFINKLEEIVIPPTFLNVTNFHNEYALAIIPEKKNRGRNEYLDKDIIAYTFYEAVIDRKGKVIKDLGDVPHIIMSKKTYKKPYSHSYFVSPLQVAIKTEKGKWQLISINQNQ
ncbi:WG repeat-containing protein [Ascidiimonas sp. W6]|uniref:WG repeat-containing protein n=1 Tax=Ascidiimonas meishanensis TaxID=3128903 RepID=UPI0030EE6BE4